MNETFLERAGLEPEALERLDRVDLGELALRRLAVEPGKEARHRDAVAQMAPRASLRSRPAFLTAFMRRSDRRRHRRCRRPPRCGAQGDGAGRRIERIFAPPAPSVVEGGVERRWSARRRRGRRRRRRPRSSSSPGRGTASPGPRAGMMRVAERQRRVADIAAAQVERPGEIVRVRDDEGVDLRSASFLRMRVELRLRALSPAYATGCGRTGSCGRRRAVDPDHVDEIDVDGRRACRRPARPPSRGASGRRAVWSQGS